MDDPDLTGGNRLSGVGDAVLEFMTKLGETLPVAVIATDAQGNVVEWSDRAEQIYGWSASETIGRHIAALTVDPLDVGVANDIMEQVSQGRPWNGTYHARSKSGDIVEVYVIDAPLLDEQGQMTGIIGCSWETRTDDHSIAPRWVALRRVASEIIGVRERERRDTARLLHDDIGQALAMIRLEIAGLQDLDKLDTSAKRRLERLYDDLDIVNKSVRKLSSDLFLKDFDVWLLVIRLYEIVDDMNDRGAIFADCEVGVPIDSLRRIPPELAYCVYSIAREAAYNSVRHSGGDHLKIVLRLDGTTLVLEVIDNGIGIGSTLPGTGRSLLEDLVTHGGGEVRMIDRSVEGASGTRVVASFPLGMDDDA